MITDEGDGDEKKGEKEERSGEKTTVIRGERRQAKDNECRREETAGELKVRTKDEGRTLGEGTTIWFRSGA